MPEYNFVGPRLTLDLAIQWLKAALRHAAVHSYEYDRLVYREGGVRMSHFECARALQEAGSMCWSAVEQGDCREAVRYAQSLEQWARSLITGEYGDRHRDQALWAVVSRTHWLVAALHYEKWEWLQQSLEPWEKELLSMNND